MLFEILQTITTFFPSILAISETANTFYKKEHNYIKFILNCLKGVFVILSLLYALYLYYILDQKFREVSIWSNILNQSITAFFVLITVYLLYGQAKDQINDGLNTIKKGVNQVKSIVS
jgi:hypothetical protein